MLSDRRIPSQSVVIPENSSMSDMAEVNTVMV
jgi:hypothetical protein